MPPHMHLCGGYHLVLDDNANVTLGLAISCLAVSITTFKIHLSCERSSWKSQI